MRRFLLGLTAVAVLGAGAACGGDDDKGPPLSAEEFVRQANQICKDRNARIAEKAKPITENSNPSAEDLVRFYVDDAIPNAREKLDELDELNPPEESQDKFKKMLAAGRKALDAAEDGFKKSTTTTSGGDDDFKVSNEEFNKLARELELTDCGDPQ